MQHDVLLYVRRHHHGWHTASVLGRPRYAVYGRDLHALKEELGEVIARDLALDLLSTSELPAFTGYETEVLELSLNAVQHERLVRVPLRFLVVLRETPAGQVHVQVPRLELEFSVRGREQALAWAAERIRGSLHLKSVDALLAVQHARKERLERMRVVWHGPGRYKREAQALRRSQHIAARFEERSPLDGIGVEMVGQARAGTLPRALHREPELTRLIDTLCRRRGRAALLVGPSGVGKTALVYELAHRIAAGRVPPRLRDVELWHITGNRLMAGMRYLGEWQARALMVAEYLRSHAGLLYAGDLGELISAGGGDDGLGAAQLFLPFLRRDAFGFIAEATPDGLVSAEQRSGTLLRALQRLEVPSMPTPRALAVLEVLAGRQARSHQVRLEDGTLEAALDILLRTGQADGLPGSGLGLLDQMIKGNRGRTIGPDQAIDAFSDMTGFPRVLLDPRVPLDEAGLTAELSARVVGQPEAIAQLVALLLVIKAGLADPDKPLGVLLLMGPTGVGKTESAKALAAWLFGDEERLVRFDMSEYAGHGAARRLVDGPRGQGALTSRVREQPFSVLLFDEIEKAEPGVFDVLLQVLGEGRLTDGTGVTVSFRHTVVLLTSNLGARRKDRVGVVGPDEAERAHDVRRAATDFFRPEFVNRLDALVPYRALDRAALGTIARGLLERALAREGIARRDVQVSWDPSVVDLLLEVGFDPRFGARPMKRAVEEEVLVPLARVLTATDAVSAVHLSVVNGAVEARAVGDQSR